MSKPKKKTKQIFSDEDIASFVELGEVLKKIRRRLLSEGYIIKDGKIFKEGKQVVR